MLDYLKCKKARSGILKNISVWMDSNPVAKVGGKRVSSVCVGRWVTGKIICTSACLSSFAERGTQGHLAGQGHMKLRAKLENGFQIRNKLSFRLLSFVKNNFT